MIDERMMSGPSIIIAQGELGSPESIVAHVALIKIMPSYGGVRQQQQLGVRQSSLYSTIKAGKLKSTRSPSLTLGGALERSKVLHSGSARMRVAEVEAEKS